MGLPVVTVASGGLPIVESTVGGTPVTEAANGRGVPVTKVVGKPGLPVVFETIGIGGAVDISKVVFIAGWEGANGATVYSEERKGAVATFSGSRISTAQFKAGSSCFDYNGGSVMFPDSIDWQLSTSNSSQFCIELFLRPTTATPGTAAIIGQDFGIGDQAWYLAANANQLEFQASPSGSGYAQWAVSTGLTWVANTWYHVAVSKDAAGKVRLFRDGVMIGSSTPGSSIIYNAATGMNLGARIPFGAPWPGFADEVRITKGDAVYSSDSGFAVPAVPLPRT